MKRAQTCVGCKQELGITGVKTSSPGQSRLFVLAAVVS